MSRSRPTDDCHYPGCGGPSTYNGYCGKSDHNKDTAYRARQKAALARQRQELEELRNLVNNAGLVKAGRTEQVA
jgi:hypothetical protein